MEAPQGIIQSTDPNNNSSPTQPENTVGNSDRNQSQPPTDLVPPPLTDDLTDDVNACELTAGGKRKKTSVVWNHFKRKTINGEVKAICNYCKKALAGRRSDGTNHLGRHYRTCK